MVSLHTNYYLSVFYFHHNHLFPCAVEGYNLIGPPEYTGKRCVQWRTLILGLPSIKVRRTLSLKYMCMPSRIHR